jgi:hypothetical protein
MPFQSRFPAVKACVNWTSKRSKIFWMVTNHN